MKAKKLQVIIGILLIIAAISLGKASVYTSIKSMVVDSGGSIALAISVAMGLIVFTFLSGVILLRKT